MNPSSTPLQYLPASVQHQTPSECPDCDNATGLAGDGTSTFYYGGASGTAFTITRFVAGATGYTQRVELGEPFLGAPAKGGNLVWDGSSLLYLVNENDTKLRMYVRSAVDTYRLVDLLTTNLGPGAQPAVIRRNASEDLVVLFRDNTTQSNGEIRYISRTSGIWNAPVTLRGGASSGWSNVSVVGDDTNAAGVGRMLYTTGTASPFGLVEDSLSLPSGTPTLYGLSGLVTSADSGAALANVPVSVYLAAACCELVTTTTTDVTGAYAFLVPAGAYKIFFDTPTTGNAYAPGYYPSASTFVAGTAVTVGANVTGINATMSAALSITTVTPADPFANDRSGHLFAMSDGSRVLIYYDGSTINYRIETNGVWAAPIGNVIGCCGVGGALALSVWTRIGDTLYGVSGSPTDSIFYWKFAYANGAITVSRGGIGHGGGGIGNPIGIYYDATNGLLHVAYLFVGCCGLDATIHAVNPTTLNDVYSAPLQYIPPYVQRQTPSECPDCDNSTALAGDGGSTFYYGGAAGTTLTMTRFVASASAYTQTIETDTPALAAPATAGSLLWDGSNILYVANENNTKIRLTTRTGINGYTPWTDLVTTALGAATHPAISRSLATNDLTLFYRSNGSQATGELHYLRRTGGSWDGTPTQFRGGGATGWGNPSATSDDLNNPGTTRVVYRTGIAAPFGISEDPSASASDFASAYAFTFGRYNVGSGAYYTSATDLQMPGRLISLSFGRSYNSADSRIGALGPGWTHTYDWNVTETGLGATVRRGSGERDDYTRNPDGTFAPPSNVYDRLTKNGDGSFTLTLTTQVQYEFSAAGVLTRIHEPAGNQMTFTYTGANLATITDTVGRNLTFGYDGSNRLAQIQDPLGRKVTYAYDAYGRLATVVDKIGNTTGQDPNLHKWQYGYGGASRHLTSVTDPDGRLAVRNTFDSQGRLIAQRDGLDRLISFAYAPGQTTTTDARNHQTTLTFDSRLRQLTQTDVVGGVSKVLTYAYDSAGNQNVMIDRDGNRTDYVYDGAGNIVSKTEPQLDLQTPRYVTNFVFDAKNNLIQISDARNYVTTNTYDPTTNLLLSTTMQIDSTTAAVTKYEYGDSLNPGLQTRIISPRGNSGASPNYVFSQTMAYDAQGNLATVIDADAAQTTYVYDAVGRRTTMIDPDGYATGGVPGQHTWTTAFDENDHVTSQTDPLGHVTSNGYDGSGNQASVTDHNGNITTYTFDAAKRPQTVVQKPDPVNQPGLNYTTTFVRDNNGNPTRVTQANNVVADYTFDELNRLTSVISHPTLDTSLTTSYILNGNGQPTTMTTGDGTSITYVYDTMARLKSIAAAGLATITYGYDELSRRTAMSDGTGNTTYQYDGLGRLTQAVQPNGTTTYGYDLDSNRTTLGYPTVGNVTYAYSPGSRLNTVTDWASHLSTYQYTAAGLAASVAVPGGMTTTYTYDRAHRLTQLVNAVGASTVASGTYTLDN